MPIIVKAVCENCGHTDSDHISIDTSESRCLSCGMINAKCSGWKRTI